METKTITLTLMGKRVKASVRTDPEGRALIEGRDLWVKIEPITKDMKPCNG